MTALAKIPFIHMPVFIINGLADKLVPPSQGKALFDAAHEPKELVQVPSYGHADVSRLIWLLRGSIIFWRG